MRMTTESTWVNVPHDRSCCAEAKTREWETACKDSAVNVAKVSCLQTERDTLHTQNIQLKVCSACPLLTLV